MKNNIILLNIGLIIVLILLSLLIIKEKKSNSKFKYCEKQNSEIIIFNKIIMEKIKKLELEVLKLKKENSIIVQQHKKYDLSTDENSINNNDFKQILNYKFFKEKNSAIINLHGQGKSKTEIAKTLNKSIREIEMVINLVR